ncbi:efflux RND transporter periplasmic adaptor subunit [Pontibacter mucosus]|nr:efflux RND transporter periplasmic adaptor subunit [Pontibacter mucosus]
MRKSTQPETKRRLAAIFMAFLWLATASCDSGSANESRQGYPGDASQDGAGMAMPQEAGHEDHGQMSRQVPGKRQPADSTDETFWSTLPANQTVISRQAVVQAGDSSMRYSFSGNGYVDFDQRRNRKFAVRVGGRIERLYIKYNYQYVRKGEKLMELYSPELNTFVEEFLFVSRQSKDPVLRDMARQKLRLLGLTEAQIDQFARNGRAPYTISVFSPYEGYVLFSPSGSGGGMGTGASTGSGGMEGMAAGRSTGAPGTVLPDNSIREGMYVSKDQTVFWVNDFLEAWGIVAFPSEAGAVLEPGRETVVTSELFPDKPIRAVIGMVEPVYSSGQKFTQVRLYLPNPNRQLKQNSLLTATAFVHRKSPVVPVTSVYYVGRTAIVWVRTGVTGNGSNIFQARAVRTGHRGKEVVEITEGLRAEDWIARDAAYLVDSETIIQYLSRGS